MSTNRDRVLEAAVDLLATEGIRSLTHLRIDERAGLPKGSTSNVFRTRDALLAGVARQMAATELPAVSSGFTAATADELVDRLVELFAFFIGPNRAMTAARLALFVEAGHDDAVRAALVEGRATIEAPIAPAFAALGADDPAFATQLIAICFEGLFLQVLGRRAEIDPRPIIAVAVRAGLGTPHRSARSRGRALSGSRDR